MKKDLVISKPDQLLSILSEEKIDYVGLIKNRNKIKWDFETQQKLLLLDPNKKWLKKHPIVTIKGEDGNYYPYYYLPIDKVEFLLRMLFGRYRIEVLREGQAFNGVYITVRVHYFNPVFDEWEYQDGIGAISMQLNAGTGSFADLSRIKADSLQKGFPAAKSLAIKDACDHIGRIFGADINKVGTIGLKDIVLTENHIQEQQLTPEEQAKKELKEKLNNLHKK